MMHDWMPHERDGWTICRACGMVRNYDRETPCRGAELESMQAFLRRTAIDGGSIVSSASLTAEQIAIARAADRMLVMHDGFGFVYVPGPRFCACGRIASECDGSRSACQTMARESADRKLAVAEAYGGDGTCATCGRPTGFRGDDEGGPPVDLGRCPARDGWECRAVAQAVAEYRRENATLRENHDAACSEAAGTATVNEAMALKIESLADELAKPEDVRLREVTEAMDGHAVIFDSLAQRVSHVLDELDEWIARAGEAERERDRLRKLFSDAGQGEHNVLALVDNYQGEVFEAEKRFRAIVDVLVANGCNCECDCACDEHDGDCERCLACLVEMAAFPKTGANR